jgi:predicted RNase H-like nuclease (RuvC/YqgF family)
MEDWDFALQEIKEPSVDIKALAESLAEIRALRQERASQKKNYESQIQSLTEGYSLELDSLRSQILELESKIKSLESEKENLMGEVARLQQNYGSLKSAAEGLEGEVDCEDIGEALAWNQYDFMIRDCRTPDRVIKVAGRLIDLRKYLGIAAEKGAVEALSQSKEILRSWFRE